MSGAALFRSNRRGSEAQLEGRDRVLDDRRDVEGDLRDGAVGEAAAAGLVAREARPVDEQRRGARARETVGGGRARRPCPDHHGVEPLHAP